VAALLGVVGGLHLFGVIGFLLGPVLLSLVVAMLRFHRDVSLYELASKTNVARDQT
jgi:predicted PurR-regulated permease PerM